jgi:hypothetical protein
LRASSQVNPENAGPPGDAPCLADAATPRPGRRFAPWLIPAAALALIPIFTLAQPGLPRTADGYVHLLRALEVRELLAAGVLLPGWAPHFYLGYGYPFFHFYAPGAHLLAGLAALTGLGVWRGVLGVQIAALLLYPTGAYLAARALFARLAAADAARPAALLSAALYLYAPLRFRELFIQGNLSQLLALGLLPWCAWLLAEAAARRDLRWSAGAGLALAALVYAHHPSAFLAFPFLAVYAAALALLGGSPVAGPLRRAGCAFLLGLLLSAAFWLPATLELRYVNIAAIESGMFNARLNLLPLAELLAPAQVLDDTAFNPAPPNSLGLLQAILAACGLAVAAAWGLRSAWMTHRTSSAEHPERSPASFAGHSRRMRSCPGRFRPGMPHAKRSTAQRKRPLLRSELALNAVKGCPDSAQEVVFLQAHPAAALWVIAGLLAASLALMLPAAAPVWERLPLARFIAFPWRLLGPALLWAALLGGAALYAFPRRARLPALLLLLILAPLSVAPYLFPRPFAPVAEPALAALARYELSGGARATASANEYLPLWVRDANPPVDLAEALADGRPLDRLDRASLPPGSQATPLVAGLLEDAYRVTLPQAAAVRLRRFFFPGWQGWLDGQPVPLGASDPFGLIEAALPAGEHELRVRYGMTPACRAGGLLALVGLAGTVGLGWVGWRWAATARRGSTERIAGHWRLRGASRSTQAPGWPVAAGMIVALTAVVLLGIGPHTRWFRARSPADAPLAMQHAVHARFANGIELLGYDLAETAPRQGDTLSVRLYWRTTNPQAENARPFLHLDAITGGQTWANQTKVHPGDKPTSTWLPGFYVVDDYRLTAPADTPPLVAELSAGLMDAAGERVALADGGDRAILARLHVRERRPLSAAQLPGRTATYRLGDAVQLVGHAVTIRPPTAGEAAGRPALDVTLYWRATRPLAADYTVFVHVSDEGGTRIAQGDGPPVDGLYPMSAWRPGQIVADHRRVALPPGSAADRLSVAVGLYTPADGARLPVMDSVGRRLPQDQIVLNPPGR